LAGRLVGRLVGRLAGGVGRSVGRSVGWSVSWLVGWLVGRSVGPWVGLSVGQLVGQLFGNWLFSGLVGRLVGWSFGRSVNGPASCLRLPDEVGEEAGTKCSPLSVQSLQMGKQDFQLHLKVNLPFESLCILFPIFHHFESHICIILISFPLAQSPPPLPLPPKAGQTCPPPFTIPRRQKCLGQHVSFSASQGLCYRYSCMMIHQAILGAVTDVVCTFLVG
jgi:hypothetical protein